MFCSQEITRGLDRMNEHKVELIYQLLMDNDLTALHNYAAKTDRLAQVRVSHCSTVSHPFSNTTQLPPGR